ncbi:MAG: heavy metal translocating P-type ATPase, partial [Lachnospiraceae bacterium]|nr:heavy metal translocating P-type ATPase [Lachnospiraceae bacterium]
MTKKQKKVLYRIIIAAVLVVLFSVLPLDKLPYSNVITFVLFMIPYLVIGYDILKKALKGIKNKQVFDENFLMAVATLGAILLGDFKEGVAVMLFYQIGELFQSYAVGKSRRNISELMDIRPDYANIEVDGNLEKVDPDEVEVGSIIVVKPGEKVPIDGVIVEGSSSLNTSALTGESVPREAKTGDEVISGCINMNGLLKIRTSKEFGESTVSKILDLVENASSKKSKSEQFISKFARYYTPAVCYCALALAILPPLVNLVVLHAPADFGTWIYRALTFLVISCPCALVISIPLSFFAGIGAASKAGVLVKGSNYMETLSQTKTVVFDKTGTMTEGVFEVTGVHHNTLDEKELLMYAAHAESFSSHPISVSIQKAYGKEIDQSIVTDIEEISGHGVTAKVNGVAVAAGNQKLMKKMGIACDDCSGIGTVVHLAIDGAYAGHLLISDKMKA